MVPGHWAVFHRVGLTGAVPVCGKHFEVNCALSGRGNVVSEGGQLLFHPLPATNPIF